MLRYCDFLTEETNAELLNVGLLVGTSSGGTLLPHFLKVLRDVVYVVGFVKVEHNTRRTKAIFPLVLLRVNELLLFRVKFVDHEFEVAAERARLLIFLKQLYCQLHRWLTVLGTRCRPWRRVNHVGRRCWSSTSLR